MFPIQILHWLDCFDMDFVFKKYFNPNEQPPRDF